MLAVIAGFVAADGRFPWVFAGLGVAAAGAWVGLWLRRPRRLERGAVAPTFSLSDIADRSWTLAELQAPRQPLVLVFGDPSCAACRALLPELVRWKKAFEGRVAIAVVSGGTRTENLADARQQGLRTLLVDEGRAVFAAYGVVATPSAVLIGADGMIAAEPALGAAEIASLVARAVETPEEPRFGRRVLLRRAAVGLASATVLPLIASACGTARSSGGATTAPKELEIDGAWLCDQRYALCTTAACEPSPSDPKIVICGCKVEDGYSIGFTSCADRSPAEDRLTSTFSTQGVTSSIRSMTCPADAKWANCLDVTCRLDPDDPKGAWCECSLVDTGPSVTFGGDCDTKTCTSVIWSAATTDLPGAKQYEEGLERVGRSANLPEACPGSQSG